MMADITTTQVSATMANGGEGEEDHEDKETNTRRERMNSTSSSTFTSSSSFRSTSTSSTTSSASSLFLLSNKPHKSHQAEWEAIRRLRSSSGHVSLQHFHLLRRLGSGDLGNVYLCRLRDHHLPSSSPHPLYAMKVVDRESLAARKKLHRADIERQILSTLDHPFLPTLYASFDASHYSCLLMEFCPGGDLHVARQRQPSARFSLSSTRFYAAEILVALEYLHMMGIVYRDLKPENVLVRGDGHIMLSDFDLSFKCDVVPKLLKLQERSDRKKTTTSSAEAAAPACSVTAPMSCFLGSGSRGGSCRIMRMRSMKTTTITTMANKENAVPSTGEEVVEEEEVSRGEGEVVAEPITARSRSFVGTHEYLAPEVISGLGHGSAVDWWTLGVFMYELLFGRTPFKGEGNEKTLVNILKQPLRFPRVAVASAGDVEEMLMAQDLISRLLVKNPKRRIGSMRGAVEIKKHGFFKGVNWALIRSVRPPEVPHTTAATAAAALQLHRRRYLNKGTTIVKGRRRPNSNYDNSVRGPRHFDFF